jgi:hypothetical protein
MSTDKFYPVADRLRAQESPDHDIRANTGLNAHIITISVPSKGTQILNPYQCIFHNSGKLEIAFI